MTFLPRSKRQVEDVVAAGPADGDAVGGVGRAVPADRVQLGQFQELLAERQGARRRRPDTARR